MNTVFNTRSYVSILLMVAIGLIPAIDMVDVKCSELVSSLITLPYLALGVALVVCFALQIAGKLPPAPKCLFQSVMILGVPYVLVLSTAIKSFGSGHSLFGYWEAGILALILIPCIVIMWIRDRRASKTAQA